MLGDGLPDRDQQPPAQLAVAQRSLQDLPRLDRQVQKTESFTGIDGINTQDRAIQEGMGPVVDRSREHLGPADRAIIQARRLLLEAVKVVGEGGTPRGIEPTYATQSAAEAVLPREADWRDMTLPAGSQIEQTV